MNIIIGRIIPKHGLAVPAYDVRRRGPMGEASLQIFFSLREAVNYRDAMEEGMPACCGKSYVVVPTWAHFDLRNATSMRDW